MKRLLAVLFSVLFIVAMFIGCAPKEESVGDTPASAEPSEEPSAEPSEEVIEGTPVGNGTLVLTDDPVEIEMWLRVNDAQSAEEMEAEPWDELAASFMELYPNVTVTLNGIGADNSEGNTALGIAASANNFPEMVYSVDTDIIRWAPGGVVWDYAPYMSDDYYNSFAGTAISTSNVYGGEGTNYITPVRLECEGWLINSLILSEYDLEVPNSFDEFISVIETLDANGVLPIAHAGSINYCIWGYHNFFNQYGLDEEQAHAFQNGEISVEDTAFVKGFERIFDIAQAGAFADDAATFTRDQAAELYATGGCAMTQQSYSFRQKHIDRYLSDPEAYPEYYDVLMNSVFRLSFTLEDDIFENDEINGIKMYNWGVICGSKLADDPQKAAATVAFIEYIVSEDAYINDWVGNCEKLPPLAWHSEEENDYSEWGIHQSYEEALNADGTFFHEPTSNFTDASVDEAYRNAVTGLILGNIDVEEACGLMTEWQATAAPVEQ